MRVGVVRVELSIQTTLIVASLVIVSVTCTTYSHLTTTCDRDLN